MAKARQKADWGRTAEIVAMIHNRSVSARHQRPASYWNPYDPNRGKLPPAPKATPAEWAALAKEFE